MNITHAPLLKKKSIYALQFHEKKKFSVFLYLLKFVDNNLQYYSLMSS